MSVLVAAARKTAVAQSSRKAMENSSWIRKMFEEGAKLKQAIGASNVFDLTLGNPSFEPPIAVQQKIKELVNNPVPGMHGYMPNAGFLAVRSSIAAYLTRAQELENPISAGHVLMTCGAGGALNVIFESILDLGDEVLVPAPYFVEYSFYVGRHRGNLVPVETRNDFQLDLQKIEEAITPRTKAILINNPNNPTGAVYSEGSLRQLAELIARKEQEFGHDILLISDEPYSKLVYDGVTVPPLLKIFPHSILVTSHSKDLGLAGERIGYAAINSLNSDPEELFNALVFNNRTLGFINAPALMQLAIMGMQEEVVGLDILRERRDLLYKALIDMGYDVVKPQGTFYMFPKSPIEDDVEFCKAALKYNLLIVPGIGFGGPGYFRLSYSSIEIEQIRRALPAFQALAEKFGLG